MNTLYVAILSTKTLIAAVLPAATHQTTLPDFSFDINVTLSEKAAATLAQKHEGIKAFASYSGYPLNIADKLVNEAGLIDVSHQPEWSDVPSKGGLAHITGKSIDPNTLKWVDGAVMVNVNIVSARKSGPDNILDCDVIDGPIPDVKDRAPITLHCALISEHPGTEVLPETAP